MKLLHPGLSTRLIRNTLRCSIIQLRHASSEKKFTPRRAVLYVPGNDERKLRKVEGLNVDCVVMDCEDGVALNRKVSKLILRNHGLNTLMIH